MKKDNSIKKEYWILKFFRGEIFCKTLQKSQFNMVTLL
nr:MAG TPA: hypothetical protein [Caudoviricetes sp.]